MKRLDFSQTTQIPESYCCECGYKLDACDGPGLPEAGDLTLCIDCASLNVFDTDLKLRRPTDEEIYTAAADSDLQILRRILLETKAQFANQPKSLQTPVKNSEENQ